MEKVVSSYLENFKPMVIYLDDLEKIVAVFSEASDDIEIIMDEYKLSGLHEINELHTERIGSLNIRIREPGVALSIEYNSSNLYIHKNLPLSRGIFEKIKQILIEGKRKYFWLSNESLASIVLALLFVILGFFIYVGISQKDILFFLFGILDVIVGIVFVRTSMDLGLNKIYLKRRKETISFWKRKKDEIILVIISAAIASILTYIFTKIF